MEISKDALLVVRDISSKGCARKGEDTNHKHRHSLPIKASRLKVNSSLGGS